MKLLHLKVKGYKNFSDVEIDFSKSQGKTLIVGTNGSGKSNLLEILSAIFSACYHKDKNVVPNFEFELEYVIERLNISSYAGNSLFQFPVFVRLKNSSGSIEMESHTENSDWWKVAKSDFEVLLPERVVAVYSGEEKRLWENYYFKSYDEYNKQYISDKARQTQKMVYLNKYYWNIIASILSIHEIEDYKNFLINSLGLNNIVGLHCRFDVKAMRGNKNAIAKEMLSILNPDEKDELDISLETYNQVKDICGYEHELFYNMIVLTLYKDYKIITELTIKCDNGIEIKNLSEGEKKLLLIFGAIMVVSGENLYLFDEPDAHLHEGRKQEIYDLIQEDDLSHFIITSHSPTLTNLFDSEKVIMLDSSEGNTNVVYGDIAKTISKLTEGQWSYINHTIFLDRTRPLLVVEGSGDVEYIRKAIDLFSIEDDQYKLLQSMDILHCGGAQNMSGFVSELRYCLPENKKVIILFDRDEAGGNGLNSIIRKSRNSKKGKENSDENTYLKDNMYCLKLPRIDANNDADFLIEDYFKKDFKKAIAQSFLDNVDGTFNLLPNNLKNSVKEELFKNLHNYQASDMEGFKVLLDKLLNIFNNRETVITV